MIHWKMPWPERVVTKRRLACAKAAIKRQKDKLALFVDQTEFEEPEERIDRIDGAFMEWFGVDRIRRAKSWWDARRRLNALSDAHRAAVLECWNSRTYPLDPAYLLTLIHSVETGKTDPVKQRQELERLRELGRKKWPNHKRDDDPVEAT